MEVKGMGEAGERKEKGRRKAGERQGSERAAPIEILLLFVT